MNDVGTHVLCTPKHEHFGVCLPVNARRPRVRPHLPACLRPVGRLSPRALPHNTVGNKVPADIRLAQLYSNVLRVDQVRRGAERQGGLRNWQLASQPGRSLVLGLPTPHLRCTHC